jgi:hypothetical protein
MNEAAKPARVSDVSAVKRTSIRPLHRIDRSLSLG